MIFLKFDSRLDSENLRSIIKKPLNGHPRLKFKLFTPVLSQGSP
ncbi:MAG: hypothetical protein ACUVUG_07615 [Candidatus Aminicenantia bacterium]